MTKSRADFVGRGEELAALTAALARAIRGDGVAVLCGGEAGIGKTRLAHEFARVARAAGATVIEGGCVDLGGAGLPYGPFAEAIRTAVDDRHLDIAGLPEAAREQLAMLVPGVGLGARSGHRDDREFAQSLLFESVLTAFEALAADRGLVVIVEDIQWAGPATRDLISFLVRNIHDRRICLLITVRGDGVDPASPLAGALAELLRRPTLERLDLGPLDMEATTEQLRSILQRDPGPTLSRTIQARSNGNPFFIEQLAWAELDGDDVAVPSGLRDILVTQLARLTATAQDVVAVVAVADDRVDEHFLSTILGIPERSLVAPLREALGARILVVEGSAVGFRHALMAEAAYADLLAGERRSLHTRCADALAAELPATGSARAQRTARIAYHRIRSGDRAAAARASLDAADAAAAVGAYFDAHRAYQVIIRALRGDEAVALGDLDRVGVAQRAGVVASRAGEAAEAVRLIRLALEWLAADADPYRHGRLLINLAEYLWAAGDPDFADAQADPARVIPSTPPTEERAAALVALSSFHQLRHDEPRALEAAQEAMAVARAVGAHREEALAGAYMSLHATEHGRLEEAAGAIAQTRLAIRRIPVAAQRPGIYLNLIAAAWFLGDFDGATEIATEGLLDARTSGHEAAYGCAIATNGADALASLGRMHEAAAFLDSSRPGPTSAATSLIWRAIRAQVAVSLDDLERARLEIATTLAGGGAEQRDTQIVRSLAGARAQLALAEGRPADVDAIVVPALAAEAAFAGTEEQDGHLIWLQVRALVELRDGARARTRRSDGKALTRTADAAMERLDQLLTRPAAETAPPRRRARGYEAMALAELGRLRSTDGPGAWASVARHWEALGIVPERLYARFREADAHATVSRSRRSGGAGLLVAVHSEAVTLGCLWLARDIKRLARRARITLGDGGRLADEGQPGPVPVPPEPGRYGLTKREIEVLGQVTLGLTNRDIAVTLLISPKTVGVHVSNILGKLGVTGRVQAATLAMRDGLIEK